MATPFEKISPTAWGVLYRMVFSDILYTPEIFEELQAMVQETRTPAELAELEKLKYQELTPVFEARYKLVERLLKQNGIKQIFELAAGFSPHGITLAQDPSVQYIEFDLPSVTREKKKIVENLVAKAKIKATGNVHFIEGDALNQQDISGAIKSFEEKSIAVVNEGLLRYLTFEQKEILARSIHNLLERFGGIWITPDINLTTHYGGLPSGKINQIGGMDTSKNLFEDEAAAQSFFEKLGFTVERHPFSEVVAELVSPRKLGLSSEQVSAMINGMVVFVMKIK
jgi:O-methyltransferase involved in polyketide biosynthesis